MRHLKWVSLSSFLRSHDLAFTVLPKAKFDCCKQHLQDLDRCMHVKLYLRDPARRFGHIDCFPLVRHANCGNFEVMKARKWQTKSVIWP